MRFSPPCPPVGLHFPGLRPLGCGGTPWPTIHFRHRGRANVAWADGHVTSEALARTGGKWASRQLGWFGPDDNSLFDPF